MSGDERMNPWVYGCQLLALLRAIPNNQTVGISPLKVVLRFWLLQCRPDMD